ncbi:MAG: hypothetical protein QG650_222, partial [Patescibacteria group bacterium]|nr:hypothetical protein [Patescibacteria group bacterium]
MNESVEWNLERTEEDKLSESRTATAADLLRAGGEYRSGVLIISESVLGRIRRIGNLAHA